MSEIKDQIHREDQQSLGWANRGKLWARSFALAVLVLMAALVLLSLRLMASLQATSAEISEHRDQLGQIASHTSTRWVGNFPENLPEIIQLIEETSETLWILVDYPGYGAYSEPALFDKYRQGIRTFLDRASDERQFLFVCYDRTAREHYTRAEIPENKFEEESESDTFRDFYAFRNNPRPKTYEAFLADLERLDRGFLDSLAGKAVHPREIVTTGDKPERLSVLIWAGDRQAIFSFFNPETEGREVSFVTHHLPLIAQLRDIVSKAYDRARPFTPEAAEH